MLQQHRASGSAILDSAPPAPPDRIFHKPASADEETKSLLGSSIDEGGAGNPALSTPGGKLLLSVSMFMQAANLADSVMPGFVPEPVKAWIAMSMEQAPLAAQQLSAQGNPMSMLSAVGGTAAAAGASVQPPAGLASMAMGAGSVGGLGGGMSTGGGRFNRPAEDEEEEESYF